MEGRPKLSFKPKAPKFGNKMIFKKKTVENSRKQYRMNSLNKPPKEISQKFSYGIEGINYSK